METRAALAGVEWAAEKPTSPAVLGIDQRVDAMAGARDVPVRTDARPALAHSVRFAFVAATSAVVTILGERHALGLAKSLPLWARTSSSLTSLA